MARTKKNKSTDILKPAFSQILACKKSDSKPYIECFFHEPENLTQKKLGFVFGVFEITDHSEDSSYIVNFLISTIKKEFYKNTKRGSIESLEAALHKANLGLSKLAQHENINWINNIHAVIGILEKNNLHISLAGKGVSLILRDNNLILLSEEEKEEVNPLKTFEDIISGKIEEGDQLIISTPEIFEIFSTQEIKKSAQRFSSDKFFQFLKTALGNELEKIATLLINFQKETSKSSATISQKEKEVKNVFSQKAFEKEKSRGKETPLEKELDKKPEKNNHLYIKEDLSDRVQKTNPVSASFDKFQEKLFGFKNNFRLPKFNFNIKKISLPKNKVKQKETTDGIWFLILKYFKKIKVNVFKFLSLALKKIKSLEISLKSITSIFPMKKMRHAFVENRKVITFSSLGIILIIILFFSVKPIFNSSDNTDTNTASEKASIYNNTSPSQEETAVESSPQSEISYLENNLNQSDGNALLILKGDLFVVGENYIFDQSANEKIDFPEDMGKIVSSTAMDDLNMIILLNNSGNIISFYPITKGFQENAIELPNTSNIKLIGTYLTYLYVLDQDTSQIYRYPRAEGGFGEKTEWLEKPLEIEKIDSIALNDSIFILSNKKIIKFFKGKEEQTLDFENLATNIIFTQEDDPNVYALDKNNSKIAVINETGKIENEFYNQAFSEAKSIVSDIENKKIYLVTESGKIISLNF